MKGISHFQPWYSTRMFSNKLLSSLVILGLILGLVGQVHPARAASYTYTATPAGNITDTGIIPDNACGATGWPNTRYFLVNDHFSVTDLNVRFTAAHTSRGQIQVILTSSPDASGVSVSQTIVATSGDTDNNYDILLDGDASGALDDNSADNTADPVDRSVSQPLLNNFDGRDARGAWRMDICDDNSSFTTGSLVSASLFFTGNPITITPPTFTQGPAILETYFIPYPEDQLWTAMGTLYYPERAAAIGDTTNAAACTDFSTFNANPRQPIIGYTGVTTSEGGTIVYYDHWEDGYELALSFPSQTTTEVWGDGILTNGRAPGDADDVLTAGQLITLSDVKNTTQAEVIDYDARDKLGATEPIAVTRSAWANGSNTLFAAGDEVYPTYMWGSDYRLPLGEITNKTYDYFQYTGVLILAAEDGTVVYIDRDNNGTPEMTCNLNQGGVCQWDDKSDDSGIMGVDNVIGNGLIAGSHIYNSDGKKFQVSLLTGDVCAGYETRSYTLLPTDRWSNQYYAPVSSSLSSRTIGTSTQTMPTVVTLYNPGTSALTVNWTFGDGTTGSQAIGANAFFSVTIPNNTAARFYAASNFYAVGTIDANTGSDVDGAAADWGYTLVPVSSMSPALIVGWAPGGDPAIPSTEDSAPIWLTGGHTANPASTTAFTVCIDEGGNGGANTDPITGNTYDRTITVTPFRQQIVYDNRAGVYGESGMKIWVCDATNGADAVITAAWGEDPDTVTTFGKPTMDMGFTIRNIRSWNAIKGVGLVNDVDGDGRYTEGDTIRYTITVRNRGAGLPANVITVLDDLPDEVQYVPNSTWVVYHDASPSLNLLDSGSDTPYPLDDSGYLYTKALPAAASFQVYFNATIKYNHLPFAYPILNIATIHDNVGTEYNPEASIAVDAAPTAILMPTSPAGYIENDQIHIYWETQSEFRIRSFKLWRVNSATEVSDLIVELDALYTGQQIGTLYDYVDLTAVLGQTYTYVLEVVDMEAETHVVGSTNPLTLPAVMPFRLYVPFVNN